jgi:hypothetical protein
VQKLEEDLEMTRNLERAAREKNSYLQIDLDKV